MFTKYNLSNFKYMTEDPRVEKERRERYKEFKLQRTYLI